MRPAVLLVATVLLAGGCGPLPNGTKDASVDGVRPGVLSTMFEDGAGGLAHVLILKPPGSGLGKNGGGFELTFGSATETTMWRHGDSEHTLSFTYRRGTQELEIDGKSWSVSGGNVFIIRLDDQWRPTVQAVPLRTLEMSSEVVLAVIKQQYPEDRELASLRVAQ